MKHIKRINELLSSRPSRARKANHWDGPSIIDNDDDSELRPADKKPTPRHIVERIFTAIGFDVDDDGTVTATNKIAKLLCEMAVKQKEFEKVGDKYKLVK